ncbi:MAG TPA: SusC/RagA family TonB-linked outer membrane protein [Gemmatimonadaceae bacterium]
MTRLRRLGATARAGAAPSHRRIAHSLAHAALALLLATSAAAAQGVGRITGTVTDSASGRPLAATTITVVGTRLGAMTDANGRYAIAGVAAGTYRLEARHLGYRARSVTGVRVADGQATALDLRLAVAPLSLEAVVTTGVVDPTSGTRVPFTVGRVSAEDAPVPATNAVETIQGKVAGVTVIPSGQPGSGTNIMLRSPASINKSNSPLIVVDGVILSQSFTGSTADLEALDIESVEVVKGAAAASLYGSRASSGVIQIRTRRGANLAEGATKVTLRTEIGNNALARKIKWAQHHYYLVNDQGQYVDANGAVVTRDKRVPEPAWSRFQDNTYGGPVYDQVEEFFKPGNFYKNSVNIAQNSGRTNWYLSLVNSREDGVVLNSGKFDQNDVRLNLDHQLRDNLRISFSGYHARTNRQELYGDTFFDLINQAPDVNLREKDPDGTPYLFQGDPEGREENPLYVLSTEDNRRRRARTQGSLEARYAPLGWLSFDGNVSYDRSDRRVNFFLDQGKKTEGFSLGGPGEISQVAGSTDALNAAASANLLGRVGELTLRSTLRALMEREDNQVTTAEGQVLTVPGVRSLDNAQQRFVSSTDEEIRSNGYFVTAGADYAGRYIADGLVRRDGSSLFGPEETWNTYYRVSGAWRMASESWWPWKAFNEFKLRASQGTAGGRPDFNDQYETFSFTEGGGLEKATLGNKFLKPELATEREFGVDAIFRNRFSLQLSYARSKVQDQLILIPLPGFFGYTSQWQNAGTVEGNTWEATLEAQMIQRPNFTWRLGLVADRSRNKITEFNRSCFTTNTIAFRCAGETLGAMYGFRFIGGAGELPADAAARASEFQVNDEGLLVWVGPGNAYTDGEAKKLWGTTTTIGTTNYGWGMPIPLKDATGSSAVVKIGDGNPDFHFGVSNNVSWKDFTLFALVDAQVGGQAYNQTNQRMYQWGRSGDVDQVGKPQERKKPIDYYVALYAANDPTDYFVEDAGFVKLREVSLRYRFGRQLTSALARFGADGASVSVIGRNLLTLTGYKGYDPEVGGVLTRLDSFDYPRYRTITGSFEITF